LGKLNDVADIKYIDYNQVLREYSKLLKEEHKCDLVVAITI